MISLITSHIAKTQSTAVSSPNQRERGIPFKKPLEQDTFTRSEAKTQSQPMFRGISVPDGHKEMLLNRIRVLYDSVSKNATEIAQDGDLGELLGTSQVKKSELARDYSGLARAYLAYNPKDALCRFYAQRHMKKALAADPESRAAKGVMASLKANEPKKPLEEKTAAILKKIESLDESMPSKLAEHKVQTDFAQDSDLAEIMGTAPVRNSELGKDFSDLAQAFLEYNGEDDLCRFHAHGHATSAILLDPQNHNAHFILGKLESEYTDALPHLKKAVSLAPYNPDYITARAIRGYFAGDLQSTLHDYTRLTEIEPKVIKHRLQKGYTLLELDKPEDALKDFQKACELEPTNYECHSGKGTTQMQLDDMEGAIKSYKTALSLRPDKDRLAEIHANLGSAYFANGNYGKAMKHLDKSIKRLEEPEALYTRAMTNMFLGRFENAAADAESARYGGFDDPSIYTVEALAHSYNGDQNMSAKVMEKGILEHPDFDFETDSDELDEQINKFIKSVENKSEKP